MRSRTEKMLTLIRDQVSSKIDCKVNRIATDSPVENIEYIVCTYCGIVVTEVDFSHHIKSCHTENVYSNDISCVRNMAEGICKTDSNVIFESTESTNGSEDKFICMYCGILFLEEELHHHIKTDHDENYIIPSKERKWKKYPTKQHFCIFCKKLQTKLARHLERQHETEEKVQEILSLQKGSLKRKRLFANIQKEGDSLFNSKCEDSSKIPIRREFSRRKLTITKVSCPHCKGLYTRKNLRNHVRLSHEGAESEYKGSLNKNIQLESRKFFLNMHKKASSILRTKVLPPLRDDVITKIVLQDELVITYANLMVIKYSTSNHHFKMIRQKIRQISRILLEVKNINSKVTDVASLFNPEHFDSIIQAIHNLAGLKEGSFRAPSFGPSSITLLCHIGKVLQTEAIKKKDEVVETNVKRFLELLTTCANALVNKIAVENRTKNQRSKIINLPKTDDVKKLIILLESDIEEHIGVLKNEFSLLSWNQLNRSVLVKIMIFNRKRPGDVEKTEIIEYKNLQLMDKNLLQNLDDSQKKIALNYGRYITRGKLNSPAPVLVSKLEMSAVDLLMKFRKDANVDNRNPYLFATPNGYNCPYFQAGKALENICISFNLTNKNLTATNLRKHLATVTSTMGKDDQNIISDFMGHALSIHNKIYKQRSIYEDIVQMGEVLSGALESSHANAKKNNETLQLTESNNNIEENIADVTNETASLNDSQSRKTDSESDDNYEPQSDATDDYCPKKTRVHSKFIKNKTTWTTPERKITRKNFEDYFDNVDDVPSLGDCQEFICEHMELKQRTAQQVRAWLISEKKRKISDSKKFRWCTPNKETCRRVFKDFYESGVYPSTKEMEKAIQSYDELKQTTVTNLRSHLQHDFKYLKKRKLF